MYTLALPVGTIIGAPPAKGPRPAPPLSLSLTGDLDTMHTVRVLADTLKAALDRPVILELSGNAWRADVVWEIARLLRERTTETTLILNDPADKEVSSGAAILALFATRAVIAPQTSIVDAPDRRHPDLALDDSSRERAERELRGAIALELSRRSLPPELADVLLSPAEPAWLVAPPQTRRIVFTEEPGALPIVSRVPGTGVRVSLTPQTAEALGLARVTETPPARGGGGSGGSGGVGASRRLDTGCAQARTRLISHLDAIDVELSRADAAIAQRRPQGVSRAFDVAIAAAHERLALAEAVLTEVPELLKTTAPGATAVGETPRQRAAAWRGLFESRRDRITALEKERAKPPKPR